MGLPGHTASPPVVGGDTPLDLAAWAARYYRLHIDLGTGDGRFAVHLARTRPGLGVIGIDTCLDHLHGSPRRLPANVRFVRLDARDVWKGEGMHATSVSVNFPYGSLLRGLVRGDSGLLERLDGILGPSGHLTIRVNERALPDALSGTEVDPGGAEHAIVRGLQRFERLSVTSRPLERAELRTFPSTWSKRLGYGRLTTAFLIEAVRRGSWSRKQNP